MISFIEEINCLEDIKVKVYYDPSVDKDYLACAWRARNPDSFYTGYMLMDKDGRISYPEGAIIPEQTDRDREILPQFIVIGNNKVSKNKRIEIINYISASYKIRNNKHENG